MQNLLSIHRKPWGTLGYSMRVWGWGQCPHPGSPVFQLAGLRHFPSLPGAWSCGKGMMTKPPAQTGDCHSSHMCLGCYVYAALSPSVSPQYRKARRVLDRPVEEPWFFYESRKRTCDVHPYCARALGAKDWANVPSVSLMSPATALYGSRCYPHPT